MNGLAVMNLSHAIAVVAHEGQSRKGAGEPYINHVERVANSVYGWQAKSLAYLHDVIEDTEIDMNDLAHIGIPSDIAYGVFNLSRQEDETYSTFIGRIITYDQILDLPLIKVKIADVEDNLSDLDATEFWSQRKKYMKALLRLQEALEN